MNGFTQPSIEISSRMATKKEKITEDDTKCSVCQEIFRNPRILPCKHTFCHECLCGVVKGREGKYAFPCPLCRASTNTDMRITIKTSDRLVNQFPVDREMQFHLERRQTCDPCKTEGKIKTATVYCMSCHEHMCTDCGEPHKKYKLNRSHQLRPSEEAPSSKERDLLQEVSRCPNHQNKNLKYICRSHDQPCCSQCKHTSHQKCSKVMLISDVVKDNTTNEACIEERTRNLMDKALKSVSALCLELEGDPSRMDTNEEDIDKQLTEYKLLINDAFESLRSSVKKAFMEEKSKILRSSETTLINATAKKTDILKKKEELEGVLSHGDDVQKYLYMRKQASSVDADATWKIAFTQKHIVLEKKMQPELRLARTSRDTDKHTILDYVLGEINNIVEVKQKICGTDQMQEHANIYDDESSNPPYIIDCIQSTGNVDIREVENVYSNRCYGYLVSA